MNHMSAMACHEKLSTGDVLSSDFTKLVGVSYGPWEPGKAVIRLDMRPHHANRMGIAHGGVILTLLDIVCGLSGIHRPPGASQRLCVTVSLTANFIASTKTAAIHGVGDLTSERKTLFYASGQLSDDNGVLLATATGVYKYLRSNS
jgi:acyl-coenzyme A thioesterase 13